MFKKIFIKSTNKATKGLGYWVTADAEHNSGVIVELRWKSATEIPAGELDPDSLPKAKWVYESEQYQSNGVTRTSRYYRADL